MDDDDDFVVLQIILTFNFRMMHFLDFWLIYALLPQNFVVAIYALFQQIFWDWKVESADFFTFRMYEYEDISSS